MLEHLLISVVNGANFYPKSIFPLDLVITSKLFGS